MKAVVVERYGKDEVRAVDVPEPEVRDGDVLVKVSAAAINPLDTMLRNGEFKRLLRYQLPFVLGHDVAGVVTRAGLYDAGHLRPLIDRTFSFGETLEALAYVELGRAKGKVVIALD
jgi:NADPH:quinone reductase-like Zn-dependent oxidoreductase